MVCLYFLKPLIVDVDKREKTSSRVKILQKHLMVDKRSLFSQKALDV